MRYPHSDTFHKAGPRKSLHASPEGSPHPSPPAEASRLHLAWSKGWMGPSRLSPLVPKQEPSRNQKEKALPKDLIDLFFLGAPLPDWKHKTEMRLFPHRFKEYFTLTTIIFQVTFNENPPKCLEVHLMLRMGIWGYISLYMHIRICNDLNTESLWVPARCPLGHSCWWYHASSSSADSQDSLPQASTEGLFAPGPSQKSQEPDGLPGKPTGVGTSS